MPDISTDPPLPSCCPPAHSPVSAPRIEQYQGPDPDLFSPRARDARGRSAGGRSGNPRGRPPGIPNPRRRVPDLATRPLGAAALLDRKPHLLRALAAQLLPPLAARDPAERLGIDLSALRTPQEARQCLGSLFAAVSRGEIAPAEAARTARRVRARLRAVRRLAGMRRRLAQCAECR